MKLRVFIPAVERPEAATLFPWLLFDGEREVLREGTTPAAAIPRAPDVELVLPAARVLFARLRLPKVGAGTIRELLPYAVEDRLLADPAHIHAVAGRTDARGETLVAVIDREWLRAMVEALRATGLRPARAWCESALLAGGDGDWNVVMGAAQGMLVDDAGAGVAFERTSTALPLAIRIALDEASARGERPASVRVHTQGDAPLPDLARWATEAGMPFRPGTRWETLMRQPARDAIDLLTRDVAGEALARGAPRVPRAVVLLAAAIAIVQFAFAGAEAWKLAREKDALEARREAIFRAAFPEARVVVDPDLQMQRNLAELRRARGLMSGDDFLAQLTRAALEAPQPARAVEYANGKLTVQRGAPAPGARP